MFCGQQLLELGIDGMPGPMQFNKVAQVYLAVDAPREATVQACPADPNTDAVDGDLGLFLANLLSASCAPCHGIGGAAECDAAVEKGDLGSSGQLSEMAWPCPAELSNGPAHAWEALAARTESGASSVQPMRRALASKKARDNRRAKQQFTKASNDQWRQTPDFQQLQPILHDLDLGNNIELWCVLGPKEKAWPALHQTSSGPSTKIGVSVLHSAAHARQISCLNPELKEVMRRRVRGFDEFLEAAIAACHQCVDGHPGMLQYLVGSENASAAKKLLVDAVQVLLGWADAGLTPHRPPLEKSRPRACGAMIAPIPPCSHAWLTLCFTAYKWTLMRCVWVLGQLPCKGSIRRWWQPLGRVAVAKPPASFAVCENMPAHCINSPSSRRNNGVGFLAAAPGARSLLA